MEGVLWKWTNYWNGWQTRWFVLEDGVLAYYKSQEEIKLGCKGSMKVLACEINVNPVDTTRMDLVIPGEQHMYLKAATSQERQRWLVALGSAKACVNNRTRKESTEPTTDTLKSKKSELRLYCDLLMQQVHMVKTAANNEDSGGGGGGADITKMNEATSLLTATCDTFIKTLEDCMKISNANFMYDMPNSHNNVTTTLPLSPTTTINPNQNSMRRITKPITRSNSQDR